MRRKLLPCLLLLLLSSPLCAQALPGIDIGASMPRGASGDVRTDRVTLKGGQLQRFTIGLTEPYKTEIFAVTTDGKKPELIEIAKGCLFHNETDEQGNPVAPSVVCFQIIVKDATYYRCILTNRPPTPTPVVPPGPAPKPTWKYLPAVEKAWGKDVAAGGKPDDLNALAAVFDRALLDPAIGTTDKFYSWLNLAYGDLPETATRYVRNALADIMIVELGSQDALAWKEPERKRFEDLLRATVQTVRFLAQTAPLPPGPVPPGPGPGPGPTPGGNLRLIMVAETNAPYPKEQVYTMTSTKLAGWLNTKCPKDGSRAGWRRYDPNQVMDRETDTFKALWAEAQPKVAGQKLPLLVIKTDKLSQAVVVPLPDTEAKTQELLEQYAGK
jgi:hypothetical protein